MKHTKPTNNSVIYLAGILILVSSGLMMIGWFTRTTWLVQLSQHTPIRFNTALSLFIVGLGVISSLRYRNLSGFFGFFVMVISGLTMIEYIFSINLKIDELFVREYFLLSGGIAPGRPAPNTAFSLFILGSLLFFRQTIFNFYVVTVLGIFWAVLVMLIGINADIGYFFGITSAYGWGKWTQMAPYTAWMITLSGATLLYIYWREFDLNERSRLLLLPISIVAVSLSLFLILWEILVKHEDQKIRFEVAKTAKHTMGVLGINLESYEKDLKRMAKRVQKNNYYSVDHWKGDAKNYVEDFNALEVVGLYSEDKITPIEVYANDENKKSLTIRAADCKLLAIQDKEGLEKAFLLKDNKSLCVIFPTNKNNLKGYLYSVINLQRIIYSTISSEIEDGYGIILTIQNKNIFFHNNNADSLLEQWGYLSEMEFKNIKIHFQIWPNEEIIVNLNNRVPLVSFIIANAIAILFAISIYFLGLAKLNQAQLKKREAELRIISQKLQSIMNSSDLSIIATDFNGLITNFNHAAERMLGYSADDMIGKKTPAVFHDEEEVKKHAADLSEKYKKTVAPNFEAFVAALKYQEVDENEWTYIAKNGRRIPVLLSVTSIKNEKGEATGYLGVALDISERKAIEKMKNEFISVVSHELRTPLTSIYGSISLLASKMLGELPENAVDLLNIAKNNSERLIRLINDILDIEKIEAGRMDFHFDTVEINSLIEEAVSETKSYSDKYGSKVYFEKTLPSVCVDADRDRLIQVLINMLSNAARFTKESGKVFIFTKIIDEKKIRVEVVDEGDGIPESFQSHVFDKFAQADSTSIRKHSGTGLGLAISKNIIEKLNGTIGFVTKQHEGTTFYFELPIIDCKFK